MKLLEAAVTLYHKAGDSSRALQVCRAPPTPKP